MEALSGKARSHLRGLGHHLKPVVLVGKEGVSKALVEAIAKALADHELIKVRLGENADGDRRELAAELATATKSQLAGQIGRTLLLYKRHPEKPVIVLPGAKRPEGKKAAPAATPRAAARASKKS